MSARNIMLGVVAGAAAGAVLGVILAPAKGSATRKNIARRSVDYAKDAKETFNEYIDALAHEYETVKEDALDWVDKGIEKGASLTRGKHAK